MEWTVKRDPSGHDTRWCEELAQRWLAEGHWRRATLVDTARAAVAEDRAKTLLIEGERRLSRGEVWDGALRVAGFFLSRGLKPGDVVSFQLPNWVEAPILALAARMCGLVINPIPPIYRESELGFILANCRAKLIFVPGLFRKVDYPAMIAGLQPGLPELASVVVVRGEGALTWDELMVLPPVDEAALPAVDPGAVMMIMYTSGTTGKPKGVMHTHFTYDHRVRAMAAGWGIRADDVIFMPSPVTHIAGAFWVFDMPWVSGACSMLIDVWTPEEGIRCIAREGCTVSGGATPFLQQLLDSARSRPDDVRSLRLFFCGGTTVSPDLIKEASAVMPQGLFFRTYGSTEMTTATLGVRDRALTELGAETDGEIVYPVEMFPVDDNDQPVAEGVEGELIARGPGLFVGYLDPNDNAGQFDAAGFYKMGDLGRIVNGHFVVITGRKKDIIIRSGENISPKEVEDVLYNHPAIVEVAIVAMPSAATGEMGCAFIIPRAGQTIDLPEMRRFLDSAGLARQKFPEHIVLVDDLPRVPSGKVKKDVLRIEARKIAEGIAA